MSEHANVMNDRVDMGHRVFLAGFFTAFGLGAALAVIGYGLTRSPWIALAGLVNVALLVTAAQFLHAGCRTMERVVWFGAVLFLGLAIIAVLMGRNLAGYHLAGQFMIPVLFAAFVATPASRAYLAHQRGESPQPHEMPAPAGEAGVPFESILATTADGVALREEAKRPALTYSRTLRLVAGLLVVCALGGIAAAVLSLLARGTGWTLIIAALLALPPASVLWALANDWYYLATTKGYEKGHLANIVDNCQALGISVATSIVILALLAILDVAMR